MKMPPLRYHRFTRAEYDRLVEHGALSTDDRIELLDGLLVVREPQGDRHAAALAALHLALQRAFGRGYHVRVGSPVALDDASEPEPDLAVVPGRPWDYGAGHPPRPVLVAEVSDTSLAMDRLRKGGLYARAGIGDYWVVNLVDGVLEVYRQPVRAPSRRYGWKYGSLRLFKGNAVVAPLARPRARIPVADVVP